MERGKGGGEKTAALVGCFFLWYEDLCVTSRIKLSTDAERQVVFAAAEPRRATDAGGGIGNARKRGGAGGGAG